MATVVFSSNNSRPRSAPYYKLLEDAGFEVRREDDPKLALGLLSDDETIERLSGASAVVAWGECYTEKVLTSLPELRVIARQGVGIDRVDVGTATARDVVVTVAPNGNYRAVAEHVIAFLFAISRSLVQNDKTMKAGEWVGRPVQHLRGTVLGIIGLGRIGRDVALRAKAMDMNVVATDEYPDEKFAAEHGIEFLDLDSLLSRSDYVTLNCPLIEGTRGIINRDRIEKMKSGAVLVNTARGGLVVEEDLVAALESGHLGGACLDVFADEPCGADNPLLKFDNVILSPHIGGCDHQAMEDMGVEASQCVVDLSRGEWPQEAVVNRELKGRWTW